MNKKRTYNNKSLITNISNLNTMSVVLHDFVDFKYNYFSFDFSIS